MSWLGSLTGSRTVIPVDKPSSEFVKRNRDKFSRAGLRPLHPGMPRGRTRVDARVREAVQVNDGWIVMCDHRSDGARPSSQMRAFWLVERCSPTRVPKQFWPELKNGNLTEVNVTSEMRRSTLLRRIDGLQTV